MVCQTIMTVSPMEAAVQHAELKIDHSGMLQTKN